MKPEFCKKITIGNGFDGFVTDLQPIDVLPFKLNEYKMIVYGWSKAIAEFIV